MESIPMILKEILDNYDYSRESLAKELGVSPSTIGRWLNAESVPRPLIEGQLREIYTRIQVTNQHVAEQGSIYELPLLTDESYIKEALDKTLMELREALHRRGRLSSRNEALDELSKLLFAHIMSEVGISKKTVLGRGTSEGAAQSLSEFVRDAFDRYLPKSLGHEMELGDFELKLKNQEDVLAIEIIEAFERLTHRSMLKGIDNIQGVDVLNDVFGKFLADSFVNEKELGQYLTPTEVVRFMVRLAIQDMSAPELNTLCDPVECSSFGLILDPSCGVGSFLTEVIRTLRSEVIERHGTESEGVWIENMVTKVLAGIDKSERMIRLALTNMAMFGFPAAHLHLANALARFGPDSDLTKSLKGRVKLILTNPPFGAEFQGNDLLQYRVAGAWSSKSLTTINSELLFVERYIDWLAPGGQFLAIVPDSILTNKGVYKDLRENIRDNVDIRSVVSLPEVTFRAAGTNTKTSILHIRKLKDSGMKRSATFFAVCQDVGFSVRTKNAHRTKTRNGHGDLPEILRSFSDSKHVSVYGRQVGNVEHTSRWDANYHISLPVEVEQRINNPADNDIFLSSVAKLSTDRTDPRRWGTGDFQYIEISDIDSETCMVRTKTIPCAEAPSRARKPVRAGDVLFSTVRPERRTVGVVQSDQDGSVCSTGLAVIRPRGIHPLVLAYLLKTDFVTMQVLRNTIGIAYPAIDEQCLLNILLPVHKQGIEALEEQAELILDLEMRTQAVRTDLANAFVESTQNWESQNSGSTSS
jgi:type I restriction-modification system DNA methylase subunit